MNSLTKPEEIIQETYKNIKDVKKSLVSLNESCIAYTFSYDTYNQKYLYDASILKERIKNVIIRTVSDDI